MFALRFALSNGGSRKTKLRTVASYKKQFAAQGKSKGRSAQLAGATDR
jgi:hypothetical protein